MPKIIKTLLLLITLILALDTIISLKVKISKNLKSERAKRELASEGIGEKITYDIKLGNITLGRCRFIHASKLKLNGRMLYLMVFETKLPRFTDTERIYADAETLLPVKVERDISNWFMREKITEEYNHQEFSVTINKRRGLKEQTLIIKKNSPIHNAILLPQYVRRVAKLEPGRVMIANLPNRRYELRLVSIEEITVPAGTFNTYHFKSSPKQIEIWLSADNRRIPVKIQSTAVFGYLMVLKEYSSE